MAENLPAERRVLQIDSVVVANAASCGRVDPCEDRMKRLVA
jgi:hypothetical protein